MSKGSESPLVVAARLLADDLSRFEALSAEVGRQAINSEKSLLRARQSLQACADHETKLAESLRGFALAMQSIQTTQHGCMDSIAAAAKRVQERQEQRAKLQVRLS